MNNLFKQKEIRSAYYVAAALILIVVVAFFYISFYAALIGALLSVAIIVFLFSSGVQAAQARIKYSDFAQQAWSIINNLPIGVIVYDTDFNVQIFNPAAEDIFGISEEEIKAQKLDTSLATDPKFQVFTQVIFSTLAPVVIKHSDPGKYPQIADIIFDAPHLELNVVTDIIRDTSERPSGFIKLIVNKTREANLIKAKAEFITVAAHQLRTPLTAVNWALEALEQSVKDPTQKELLDTAFGAVKNSLKIVNDLLDVSKIEEGRFGYEFREVNIIEFLERALTQVTDISRQYGIKFYFDHSQQADIPVSIDEQKMGIVFFNLFDNAIQYNVENGEITVQVKRDMTKNTVIVSVHDTGIGIPPEELNKLFTKFFRAENAQKTVANGNGLGLYIAHNIVRAHGGDMWVESELNRGSTFFVSIPVQHQAASDELLQR